MRCENQDDEVIFFPEESGDLRLKARKATKENNISIGAIKMYGHDGASRLNKDSTNYKK